MDAKQLQYMHCLKLLIQRGEKCICYGEQQHTKANAERRHNPRLLRYRTRMRGSTAGLVSQNYTIVRPLLRGNANISSSSLVAASARAHHPPSGVGRAAHRCRPRKPAGIGKHPPNAAVQRLKRALRVRAWPDSIKLSTNHSKRGVHVASSWHGVTGSQGRGERRWHR